MEWIIEMIMPVIEKCDSPEAAKAAVIEWAKFQHPRDAALGLMAIDIMNVDFSTEQPNKSLAL